MIVALIERNFDCGKLAGIQLDPRFPWYRKLDQGMGATLDSASAMNAYTLTDRATWANFNNRQHLEILTAGDPILLNPYASILVNPAKKPQAKFSDAQTWHEWLTSKPGADAIASYRINGEQVFFPLGNGTNDSERKRVSATHVAVQGDRVTDPARDNRDRVAGQTSCLVLARPNHRTHARPERGAGPWIFSPNAL
jgi:hypothetical protein